MTTQDREAIERKIEKITNSLKKQMMELADLVEIIDIREGRQDGHKGDR